MMGYRKTSRRSAWEILNHPYLAAAAAPQNLAASAPSSDDDDWRFSRAIDPEELQKLQQQLASTSRVRKLPCVPSSGMVRWAATRIVWRMPASRADIGRQSAAESVQSASSFSLPTFLNVQTQFRTAHCLTGPSTIYQYSPAQRSPYSCYKSPPHSARYSPAAQDEYSRSRPPATVGNGTHDSE